MTELVKEYGQTIVAVISAVAVISLFALAFLAEGGEVRDMVISLVGRYIGG